MQNADDILQQLNQQANPVNVAGMARFGIRPAHPLGISMKTLREMSRTILKETPDPAARHALALELWASGIHEARILASIVDVPALVSQDQMEAWAADFDSWDIVDQCCGNLFDKLPNSPAVALTWSAREEEFVRRAGFSLMAYIAVHAKRLPDDAFEPFLQAILARCTDERNFVKKAVNWALRAQAIQTAQQMQSLPSRAARWNAADTLRELLNRG